MCSEFLFSRTCLERIEAKHDVQNVNSGKVLLKSGFIFEGIQRKRGKIIEELLI